MKQLLRFLHSLYLHNDKEWFEAHKAEYLKARETIALLTGSLIKGIRTFDDTIGPLSVSDCTFRIYRDVRFSKDKSPYKTYMGIYIVRGGRKSGYSGYYFHLDGASNHFLAIGNYFTEANVLKTIKADTELGGFRRILNNVDPGFVLDTEASLKRVPKAFPADSPDAEFFKLKNFCLIKKVDEDFLLAPDLSDRLITSFKTGKPFLDYVNRAIDFCRENTNDYYSSIDF